MIFQKNKIQKKYFGYLFNYGYLFENKTLSMCSSVCDTTSELEDVDKLNIFSEKYNVKWKIIIDQQKPNFNKLKNVDIIVANLKCFTIDNISHSNKLVITNNILIPIKDLVKIDKKINELYISDSIISDIDNLNILKNIKILYFGKNCKFLVKKSNKKLLKTINIDSQYLKDFKYYEYLNLEFVVNNKIKQHVIDDYNFIEKIL